MRGLRSAIRRVPGLSVETPVCFESPSKGRHIGMGMRVVCPRFSHSFGGNRQSPVVVGFKRSLTTVTAGRKSKVETVDPEIQAYWDTVLESVDKPSARKLLEYVDTSAPLGLPHLFDSSKSKGARPPAFSFFYDVKVQHPDKVVLVRVGEFYETIGIDAILLVQHAGLNPMGKDGNPPRAGMVEWVRRGLMHGELMCLCVHVQGVPGQIYGGQCRIWWRVEGFLWLSVKRHQSHTIMGL